ncbi:hypothetical protein GR223_05165 [Rhizobium leguminosarum]|uniref:hypothetical protein n=1 Tax=Rhizobium ruizarguesonis TaxID=2081791 RepID=UPI0013DFA97A|nr:hypothetical protein [Rhizobium ruizarguesonis]NEJ85341.1 hypothetical protein [Rhizobium ruizarguesonis]
MIGVTSIHDKVPACHYTAALYFVCCSTFAAAEEPILLDDQHMQVIEACVKAKMTQRVDSFTRSFRTETRYLEAPNEGFNICATNYTPCKATNALCGEVRSNGAIPEKPDDVVEGKVLQGGKYETLASCDRYRFEGPVSTPHDGLEKFETHGTLYPSQNLLVCSWYTEGEGEIGGGGGHVYGGCRVNIVPVLNDDDIGEITEQCMDENP